MTDTGWFSQKQYEVAGSVVYEGEDGLPVHVTEVTTTGLPPKMSTWDDFVCKGKLGKILKYGRTDDQLEIELRPLPLKAIP